MALTRPAWSALFVVSPSPGTLLRFLERRLGSDLDARAVLLSDAVGTSGERALVGTTGPHPSPWMETAAPLLAAALSTPVTLLFADEVRGVWSFALWAPGAAPSERGEEQVSLPNRSLWARLVGVRPDTASARAQAWALGRGIGAVERVPGLARQSVPVIDYVTVAQLDQRGLLVENSPRLYRFEISGPA